MLKISIPTPCYEDWNKMTPDDTGRYCSACAKSVVDFTNMSDEEVKHFFLNKKQDERVCGRFKQTQLHRIVIELPQNIFSIQMPLWKKFLAACLLVFSTTLFSCDTKIKGAVDKTGVKTEKVESDNTGYVGGLMITYDSIPEPPAICNVTVGYGVPIVKGGIDIVESPGTTITDTVGNYLLPAVRDTTYNELYLKPKKAVDSITLNKTKNPPGADSNNCNTIKNYY